MNQYILPVFAIGLLAGSGVGQVANWTQVPASGGPGPRQYHTMEYVDFLDAIVLFGGYDNGNFLNDLWQWDGTTWTQIVTANSPPPRAQHVMTYDEHRQKLVVHGGTSGSWNSQLSDTWEWDGVDWQQVGTGPTVADSCMVYDSTRHRSVLFGGRNATTTFNFTYTWNGTNWTLLFNTPGGPQARQDHAMAYDPLHDRIVMHGGGYGRGIFFWRNDTWTFDGLFWSPVTAPFLGSHRDGHAMAYDHYRSSVVLHGGRNGTGPNVLGGKPMLWDGQTWSQINGTSTLTLWHHAIAYRPGDSQLTLYGGEFFGGPTNASIWEWGAGTTATSTSYGTGCGIPVPTISTMPGTRATLAMNHVTEITNASLGYAWMSIGTNNQTNGASTLPLDLAPLGMSGCFLAHDASLAIGMPCQITGFTRAEHDLYIPNIPSLTGTHLFLQAWTLQPSYNHLGIALSNPIDLRIGDV